MRPAENAPRHSTTPIWLVTHSPDRRTRQTTGGNGKVGDEGGQGDERHCRDQPHQHLEHDRDCGTADGRTPSLRCVFGSPHPTRQIAGVAKVVDRFRDRRLGGHATHPEDCRGVGDVVGELLTHQASLPAGQIERGIQVVEVSVDLIGLGVVMARRRRCRCGPAPVGG
jgi:hypothetical protein